MYRRTYSTHGRAHSTPHRSHYTLMSSTRYIRRGYENCIGYRYIKKETMITCAPVNGFFLQQVSSEFVLKEKKAIYQKVINHTFQRIQRLYRGFKYVVQSEIYEKKENVYVRFLLDKKHTEEAEH